MAKRDGNSRSSGGESFPGSQSFPDIPRPAMTREEYYQDRKDRREQYYDDRRQQRHDYYQERYGDNHYLTRRYASDDQGQGGPPSAPTQQAPGGAGGGGGGGDGRLTEAIRELAQAVRAMAGI